MSRTFPIDSENAGLRMHECGQNEYWYYNKSLFPSDHPLLYQELIDNATSEIIIWDPYFNVSENDHYIFANINNDITIKILVVKGLDGPRTYLTDVQNAMKTIISPTKNCRFGLRVVNKGDSNQFDLLFHDRFLIIDDSDVYLIGSSLGYHLKSIMSTGILKLAHDDTKAFIKSIFQHNWDNSSLNQIPLTFLHL